MLGVSQCSVANKDVWYSVRQILTEKERKPTDTTAHVLGTKVGTTEDPIGGGGAMIWDI